jgi:serine/threonine-protein kinase
MQHGDRLKAALADRYRIEGEIGRGGMATVYLAEDLKHRRKVAVKVLDPEISAVVGTERFLAEIETTANLQHPHILPLFDSGEADGFLFYVMPFVEGESLRDRLDRETQLPVEDAVQIAREVADGLSHAHGLGVIHRDIKPENVLLSGGHALIADFGIARAVTVAGGTRLTETGLSLGTPYYMSPEQASGEVEVDARSDLYSLGCVVYEMLAGEPPYTGPNAQAIISKVLTQTASRLREVRETVPPGVELAVAKALARLPADRWSSAEEFSRALSDPRATSGVLPAFGVEEEEGITKGAAWRVLAPRVVWGMAALALVSAALAGLLGRITAPDPRPGPVTAFSVDVPEHLAAITPLALSPDGRTLAYFTRREGLKIRRLEKEEVIPVPGALGMAPFFSRDGRSISFQGNGGGIWSVAAAGGEPTLLARPTPPIESVGATWLNDSTMIYSAATEGLWEISDRGGEARQVVSVPGTAENTFLAWPHALPDGRRIVYTSMGASGLCGDARVVAHDLETEERITVAEGAGYGVYSPSGHVLYASAEGTISAVPFDPDRMEVTGPPFAVETGLRVNYFCAAPFAVSEGGTLAFVRGSAFQTRLLFWYDRNGEEIEQIGDPVSINRPTLSPDGTRIAGSLDRPGSSDIYTIDTRTGVQRRITSGPGGRDHPAWSWDGSQLAYHSWREGEGHVIAVVDLEGSGQPRVVYTGGTGLDFVYPRSWSPQGWLAFEQASVQGPMDILAIRLDGSEEVLTIAGTEAAEVNPTFSPDGRWIAYQSYETDSPEIYVAPFPELVPRYPVSSNEGIAPRWSQTGNELFFYSSAGGGMFSVRYSTEGGVFRWETPTFLCSVGVQGVSPDAQRFLVNLTNPDGFATEIHVVENWFQVVQELEGGG